MRVPSQKWRAPIFRISERRLTLRCNAELRRDVLDLHAYVLRRHGNWPAFRPCTRHPVTSNRYGREPTSEGSKHDHTYPELLSSAGYFEIAVRIDGCASRVRQVCSLRKRQRSRRPSRSRRSAVLELSWLSGRNRRVAAIAVGASEVSDRPIPAVTTRPPERTSKSNPDECGGVRAVRCHERLMIRLRQTSVCFPWSSLDGWNGFRS
jgi:hypothetical protein